MPSDSPVVPDKQKTTTSHVFSQHRCLLLRSVLACKAFPSPPWGGTPMLDLMGMIVVTFRGRNCILGNSWGVSGRKWEKR